MSTPVRFPSVLIAAIHMGDKREIAAEMACWDLSAGVVAYHGMRLDGTCTCGNVDCPNAGKHPDPVLAPRGSRSATRDPRRAAMWFETHPDHNLALCLGLNLVALDWDPRHGADLTNNCGLPSRTMTAQTGGGGMHRLYRHAGHQKLKGGYITPGVEVRTGNQVIVVEKSRHHSGAAYEWRDLEAPIASLPRAVATRLLSRCPQQSVPSVRTQNVDFTEFETHLQWPDVKRLRQELLRGKHRHQARLLLDGKWERAGCASQSEAEYNLVLMVSGLTRDRYLWQALLMTSGLAKRDRERTRRDDGHGNKLIRPGYIESLFTAVTNRRNELRAIGDPNLALAQEVFSLFHADRAPSPMRPILHPSPRDVIDAKKNKRGRPKGSVKRHMAGMALITFLGNEEVVVDYNGFVRVPMGEAAKAMQISRETLKKAVNDLILLRLVDTIEPIGYRKSGSFAKDRYLRLTMNTEEAIARVQSISECAGT
jgi:hypothetical protein